MQNTTTLCSTFGHTGPFQTNLIMPHTREDGTLSLTFGSEKSVGIWALQESYAWLGTTPWVSFPCTPTWTCRCRSASLWASSSPWVHWSLARSSSSTSTSGCSCFCFPGGHTRIGEKATMGPSSRCNHTSGWQQLCHIPHWPGSKSKFPTSLSLGFPKLQNRPGIALKWGVWHSVRMKCDNTKGLAQCRAWPSHKCKPIVTVL